MAKFRINYKILDTHSPNSEDKFISAICNFPDACDVLVMRAFDCNPQFKILELSRENVADSFANGLYPYAPEKVVVGSVEGNTYGEPAPRLLIEPDKS